MTNTMNQNPRVVLNAADALVLGALSDGGGDYFDYLRVVADRIGMPHREVRVRCRRLVRKGFARLEHLFSEDDGLTAGSTYVTTRQGKHIIKLYREMRGEA